MIDEIPPPDSPELGLGDLLCSSPSELPDSVTKAEMLQTGLEEINQKVIKANELSQLFEETRSIALMTSAHIRGDYAEPSILDLYQSVQRNFEYLTTYHQLDPEKLPNPAKEINVPELTLDEESAIGYTADLAGAVRRLAYSSNHGTAQDHQEAMAALNELWQEVAERFSGNQSLLAQVRKMIVEYDIMGITLQEAMTYSKPERDAFEATCKENIRRKSLDRVRPGEGEMVLFHRTPTNPDIFFETGLGFSHDILSTATAHYESTSDEELVDNLFRQHKWSNFVIVATLPKVAYIRYNDESKANIKYDANIADQYLTDSNHEFFAHLLDRRYIKGAVNRVTGEFIPNPNYKEDK